MYGISTLTQDISTHAPAWGATGLIPSGLHQPPDFYSRPRVGGDLAAMPSRKEWVISTHAPAWGATNGKTLMFFR